MLAQYVLPKYVAKKALNNPFHIFLSLILSILICLTLFEQGIDCRSSGIMEITFNNLKNVLNTYPEIHILFHNPQCLHSIRYSEQFLKIIPTNHKKQSTKIRDQQDNEDNQGDDEITEDQMNQSNQQQNSHSAHNAQNSKSLSAPQSNEAEINLGIVDCLRQIQLCQHFSLKHFPALVKVYKELQKSQFIDEQQFLVDFGIQTQNSDNYLLNKLISYLKDEEAYAVVVLEQQGLPVKNRLSHRKDHLNDMKVSQRVFYLQPSTDQRNSNFSDTLLSFVDRRTGCWIFSNKNNEKLQKFYCGDGHNPEQIQQYVNQFRNSNSSNFKRIIFSQSPNQKSSSAMQKMSINAQILYDVFEKHSKNQRLSCRLIYFFSNNCKYCSSKDITRIRNVLTKMNLWSNPFILNLYDVQKNQIPSWLLGGQGLIKNLGQNKKSTISIKRVPEMLYICNGKIKIFGEVFFEQILQEFIRKTYYKQDIDQSSQIETIQEKSIDENEEVQMQENDEAL